MRDRILEAAEWYRQKYQEHVSKCDELKRKLLKLEDERDAMQKQIEALLAVIESTKHEKK